MTAFYNESKNIIRQHIGANQQDVVLTVGSGMTGAVNKLQRILGLHVHERWKSLIVSNESSRPVVFISHMEHHSNQVSWEESLADVVIIPPDEQGLLDWQAFNELLQQYADRPLKIASITAASNVTGIEIDIHRAAKLMHEHEGFCFADYAFSAPYVDINMHPRDPSEALDAVYFSPHKFLGGPGSSGVLAFNSKLYNNKIPDQPGGGTVKWTNPWHQHAFIDSIEEREDGGTPAILQTLRAGLACIIKDQMNTELIRLREEEQLQLLWPYLDATKGLTILAGQHRKRLGAISIVWKDLDYEEAVKRLNERHGIQTRSGCSCAGTYGHFLFSMNQEASHNITCAIDKGDSSGKPGWLRLSLHPSMSNQDIHTIGQAIQNLANPLIL